MRARTAWRVGALGTAAMASAGALSAGLLTGCPNDHADCAYDAGPDGAKHRDGSMPRDARPDAKKHAEATMSDVGTDAGVDGPLMGHDGGSDAPRDAVTSDVSDAKSDARDVAVDAFTCPSSGTPATQPCSISETYGVFVAPPANGGVDAVGRGSRARPFATLSYAVANTGGLHVYACAATYPEVVTVSASVNMYGGLACPVAGDGGTTDAATDGSGGVTEAGAGGAWSYNGQLAVVAPGTSGPVLTVDAPSGAQFEDMGFTSVGAPAAESGDGGAVDAGQGTLAAGTSSIAVLVNDSNPVSFLRVKIVAGSGAPGAAGTTGSDYATGTPAAMGSSPLGSSPQVGPLRLSCACGTTGGPGGNGDTLSPGPGENGSPVMDGGAAAGFGVGGTWSSNACGAGHTGESGTAGAGGGGATSAGGLSGNDWVPSIGGSSGAAADPGQGGGGGSGGIYTSSPNGGGGGGGCGGCGGAGATGGGTGGSSLALVSVGSTVTLQACTLIAGSGGEGGAGGAGQQGQAGGGFGEGAGNGCQGGNGGSGGNGGGGGGGAGGLSVAIAYTGTEPNEDGTTTTSVQPSARGGMPGMLGQPPASAGAPGVSADVLPLTGDAG